MMASLSISCFSNADILFFNSSITMTLFIFSRQIQNNFFKFFKLPFSCLRKSFETFHFLLKSILKRHCWKHHLYFWMVFLEFLCYHCVKVGLFECLGDSGMTKISESNTKLSEVWLNRSTE